jgi:hypothetical protein
MCGGRSLYYNLSRIPTTHPANGQVLHRGPTKYFLTLRTLPSIVAGVAPRPLGNRPLRAQCNGALSCLCCGNLTYIVALTLIRQGNPARRLHAYQSRVPSSWRFTSVPDNQIDKRWQKSIVTGCSLLLRHKHQRLRVAGIETCAVWS